MLYGATGGKRIITISADIWGGIVPFNGGTGFTVSCETTLGIDLKPLNPLVSAYDTSSLNISMKYVGSTDGIVTRSRRFTLQMSDPFVIFSIQTASPSTYPTEAFSESWHTWELTITQKIIGDSASYTASCKMDGLPILAFDPAVNFTITDDMLGAGTVSEIDIQSNCPIVTLVSGPTNFQFSPGFGGPFAWPRKIDNLTYSAAMI
jgi:hypothetical protein